MHWPIVFLLALLQFCLFLNRHDITTAFEGRVAATAREMLERRSWILPYCNAVPRVLKPPIPYWGAMVGWKIAGSCEVWLARLPAALCGALGVLLIMDIGRRILGPGGDFVCGFIWISTWFIVDEYRKAMADPYLGFFVLLGLWAWILGDELAHRRPAPRARAADAMFLLCYISAGLAALAKGHLVLIHLPILIVAYQWLLRRRWPGRPLTHIVGVILMAAVGVPWFVYVIHHVPDATQQWKDDAAAANATSGPKSNPWFHYLINLPVLTAPWSVYFIVGVVMAFVGPRRRQRRHEWAVIALAVVLLIFSIAPMKKNTYLLPMLPAATLISAAPIVSILKSRQKPQKPIDRILFAGHAIVAGAALSYVLYRVLNLNIVNLESPGPILSASAIALFLILGARRISPTLISRRTFAATALGFALAVHGVESWIWPEWDNRRSDAPLAESAITLAPNGPLMWVGGGPREDVLFYLQRTVTVLDSANQLPGFYRGLAIVTNDQFPALKDRGDVIGASSERHPYDTLYLMQFPKSPIDPRSRDR